MRIEFNNERYFEYKEWSESKFNLKKVYRLINKYCPNGKGKKLLDIGCVDGSFALKLKEGFNYEVYGIDIVDNAIKKAELNKVKAIVGDLEKELPYKNNEFNVIIMCEVIEHIFDTDNLLNEIRRVLKYDGLLFVTTPNTISLMNRIRILFGGYPNNLEYCSGKSLTGKDTKGHIRAYTPKILRKQLERSFFNVIKITSPNLLFPILNKKIPLKIRDFMIDFSDITKNLGEQIVVVAKKEENLK